MLSAYNTNQYKSQFVTRHTSQGESEANKYVLSKRLKHSALMVAKLQKIQLPLLATA